MYPHAHALSVELEEERCVALCVVQRDLPPPDTPTIFTTRPHALRQLYYRHVRVPSAAHTYLFKPRLNLLRPRTCQGHQYLMPYDFSQSATRSHAQVANETNTDVGVVVRGATD